MSKAWQALQERKFHLVGIVSDEYPVAIIEDADVALWLLTFADEAEKTRSLKFKNDREQPHLVQAQKPNIIYLVAPIALLASDLGVTVESVLLSFARALARDGIYSVRQQLTVQGRLASLPSSAVTTATTTVIDDCGNRSEPGERDAKRQRIQVSIYNPKYAEKHDRVPYEWHLNTGDLTYRNYMLRIDTKFAELFVTGDVDNGDEFNALAAQDLASLAAWRLELYSLTMRGVPLVGDDSIALFIHKNSYQELLSLLIVTIYHMDNDHFDDMDLPIIQEMVDVIKRTENGDLLRGSLEEMWMERPESVAFDAWEGPATDALHILFILLMARHQATAEIKRLFGQMAAEGDRFFTDNDGTSSDYDNDDDDKPATLAEQILAEISKQRVTSPALAVVRQRV